MLCEICGEKEATHTCRLCGRRVCDEHYDPATGLCTICSQSLCEICGERLASAYCEICGRYVCYDCSIQVTPAVRVCKECFSKLGWRGVLEELKRRRSGVPRLLPIRLLAARIRRKHT